MGSAPSPNRLSRTTDPSTAIFAALLTSVLVKKLPDSMSQKRINGSSMSVPSIARQPVLTRRDHLVAGVDAGGQILRAGGPVL